MPNEVEQNDAENRYDYKNPNTTRYQGLLWDDTEDWNCWRNKDVINENLRKQLRDRDWGRPGMRHAEVDNPEN